MPASIADFATGIPPMIDAPPMIAIALTTNVLTILCTMLIAVFILLLRY
jgi:hypothetical protein